MIGSFVWWWWVEPNYSYKKLFRIFTGQGWYKRKREEAWAPIYLSPMGYMFIQNGSRNSAIKIRSDNFDFLIILFSCFHLPSFSSSGLTHTESISVPVSFFLTYFCKFYPEIRRLLSLHFYCFPEHFQLDGWSIPYKTPWIIYKHQQAEMMKCS